MKLIEPGQLLPNLDAILAGDPNYQPRLFTLNLYVAHTPGDIAQEQELHAIGAPNIDHLTAT